jgi:hypothetical protein
MSVPDTEPASYFVDTNIRLYAFVEGDDLRKYTRAKSLLEANRVVIVSPPVINEVCQSDQEGAVLRAASPAVDRIVLCRVRRCRGEQGAIVEGFGLTGAVRLLFLGQHHRRECLTR